MKKRFLFIYILFIVISIFSAFTISASSTDVSIEVEGAQVRTVGNAGIRFVGNVNDYDCTNVTKYGMVLAFGEIENIEDLYINATVNEKETYVAEVEYKPFVVPMRYVASFSAKSAVIVFQLGIL